MAWFELELKTKNNKMTDRRDFLKKDVDGAAGMKVGNMANGMSEDSY